MRLVCIQMVNHIRRETHHAESAHIAATRFTVVGSRHLQDNPAPVQPGTARRLTVVSDFGSERERPAARMWARCGQLDRAQCSDQRINPSSGPLFERSRGSGRRGRRFKSGHPDRETAGHKANSDLPLYYTFSGARFGSPLEADNGAGNGQRKVPTGPPPTGPRLASSCLSACLSAALPNSAVFDQARRRCAAPRRAPAGLCAWGAARHGRANTVGTATDRGSVPRA